MQMYPLLYKRGHQSEEVIKTLGYVLNEPPNPAMGWYTVPSLTTISALPMGPGVTKLMGDDGANDVKSFDRSHVVCHCEWVTLATTLQGEKPITDNIPYLLREDRKHKVKRYQNQRGPHRTARLRTA